MGFNGKLFDGLLIFVEVINAGSFTKAALSSGFSTSYISKEINKLEARLGVRLINRSTRSISLTPEGEFYYQHCQQLQADAQQAEDIVLGRQREAQGLLKISLPVGFALSRIRPILAEFMDFYPKISLDIDLNDRQVDLIADGFDLAVRISGKLQDSTLICKRLLSCRIVTVASPAYLQEYGKPTHPNELIDHKTISYSNLKNPLTWSFALANQKTCDVRVKSHVCTNNSELELALCLAGQGITRLPEFYLSEHLSKGLLVQLFGEYHSDDIGVFLVYPSRKHMSAKVRCFIDFMEKKLGDEGIG